MERGDRHHHYSTNTTRHRGGVRDEENNVQVEVCSVPLKDEPTGRRHADSRRDQDNRSIKETQREKLSDSDILAQKTERMAKAMRSKMDRENQGPGNNSISINQSSKTSTTTKTTPKVEIPATSPRSQDIAMDRSHEIAKEFSSKQQQQRTPRSTNVSPRTPVSYSDEFENNSQVGTPKSKNTNDLDGGLRANSIGANVRILYKGREISRMHWAAIAVPWSGVKILQQEAQKGQNSRDSYSPNPVEIQNIEDEDRSIMFQEDFQSVFESIFKRYFVPLVHAKFNGQGTIPQDLLPDNVETCFKLLVLAERLKAAVMQDLYEHLQALIHATGSDEMPLASVSYMLINTSLSFSTPPAKKTLQHQILQQAIDTLVKWVPLSIPALEDLVQRSCINRRPDMAVLLFQKTSIYALSRSEEVMQKQMDAGATYLAELESRLTPQGRLTTQMDLFCQHVDQGSKTFTSTVSLAGLQQGVLLGSNSGEKWMRVTGDALAIGKPGKPGQQTIAKRAITNIASLGDANSFSIASSSDNTIVFNTVAGDVRDAFVAVLQKWHRNGMTNDAAPPVPAMGGGSYKAPLPAYVSSPQHASGHRSTPSGNIGTTPLANSSSSIPRPSPTKAGGSGPGLMPPPPSGHHGGFGISAPEIKTPNMFGVFSKKKKKHGDNE